MRLPILTSVISRYLRLVGLIVLSVDLGLLASESGRLPLPVLGVLGTLVSVFNTTLVPSLFSL